MEEVVASLSEFWLFRRVVMSMKRFQCNIGKGGRILRVVVGLVLLFDAWLLWKFQMPENWWWSFALQALLALMGAFSIFEGVVGWCAVRALGIRTRF